MDKLIVTIIGISLAAVVSIGGGDYLYTMYTRATAKTLATQWLAEAGQIEVAAKQAGNLAYAADDWTAGTAGYLVPTYLMTLPKHDNAYVFTPCYLSGSTTTCPAAAAYSASSTIIKATVENAAVCEEINARANRGTLTLTANAATTFAASTYNIAKNANVQFGCAWFDTNANGAYDKTPTDDYVFLYRVYMDK